MTPRVPIGCAFLPPGGSFTKSGGVASLDGGEAFRFTTVDTLRARGPLWVLSTGEQQFLADGGRAHPYLRHVNYLPTPATAIAQELGVRDPRNAADAVQLVSEVLTRVGGMAQSMTPDLELLDNTHLTLAAQIQALVAPPLRHEEMPRDLHEAMPFMFKAPAPMAAANAMDIAVRIPANRLKLAEVVLRCSVPAGHWREIDFAEYPSPSAALSAAIGDLAPALCYVTIRGVREGVKAQAPLMRNLTLNANRWMALPEVVAMSRLVDMTPKRMFVADEIVPAAASLKVPPPAFSPAAAASISAGLYAEAYLQAVSSSATALLPEEPGLLSAPQMYSVRAAWLTSHARSLMIQEGITFANANFSVMGFGLSHIQVGVNRRNLRMVRKAVAASKLLAYPTGLRAHEEQPTALQESHTLLAGGGPV